MVLVGPPVGHCVSNVTIVRHARITAVARTVAAAARLDQCFGSIRTIIFLHNRGTGLTHLIVEISVLSQLVAPSGDPEVVAKVPAFAPTPIMGVGVVMPPDTEVTTPIVVGAVTMPFPKFTDAVYVVKYSVPPA